MLDDGLQELASSPALGTLLLDSLDRAVIATAVDGRVFYWNSAAEALYGWTADEALGASILDLTPAIQTQAQAEQIMARLQAGGRWEGEILLKKRDGETFAAYVVDSPVLDAAGRLVAIVGVSGDVSDRRRRAQRQAMQVDEYRHRMKNLLAGFQFMTDQAFRSDADPARVHAALTARVKAMARAQDLASAATHGGVDLRALAEAALAPFDGAALALDGPLTPLREEHVALLAMALHELATNAVKYGAWSAKTGAVRLAWSCAPSSDGFRIELNWVEDGGPPATTPQRRGFGLRMLADGLPRQLDGSAALDFTPDGVRYRLSFSI